MKLGALVDAQDGLGVGKIASLDGDTAAVEYFESVAVRHRRDVPLGRLKPAQLYPETRCYLLGEDGETWRAGRIGLRQETLYEVKLPDLQGTYAPESRIYVRYALPMRDPLEVLIHRAHDTAFFAERRFPFVRSLVEQRAATRGLSGLYSSRIELFAHQVEVVRRVLEDPVQRYLLADEVGLGKTIEAGAILRQFLLDRSSGRALVLVPPLLKEQWTAELDDKFGVFDFADRVEVRGTDEIDRIPPDGEFQFVVIDEAHHVAELAVAADSSPWDRFRTLAQAADRLLLLSATPALHNEQAYLAMLHLLDPGVYQLDQLEAFRERVRRRQDVGRFLLAFSEGAAAFTLRRALGRVREMFPQDPLLNQAAERLAGALDGGELSARDRWIRHIRTHIAETYRLHRRLLRNRRASVERGLTAGRGGEGADWIEEYDLDARPERLHVLLDDWRIGAYAAASEASEADAEALLRVFLALFEASGTWLGLFEEVLRVRRGEPATGTLHTSLGERAVAALVAAPSFPGETALLDAMLDVLAEPAEDGDRIDLLRRILESLGRRGTEGAQTKVVVFTSFPRVGREIVARLRQVWGAEKVALYGSGMAGETVEGEVQRFREEPGCGVLVCDRAGEEGRNLQFADWLIHFDLPFSPSRLEQRIGRLDRIGRVRTMRSRAFVGPEVENSLSEAWLGLLRDGFGVFRESIASLQFFIDAKLPELAEAMFRNGAQGLREAMEPMRAEIEQEQLHLSEQYALDEIDALESDAQAFFRNLDEFDSRHERLQKDAEVWICDALHFVRQSKPGVPHVISYRPERTRGATTLVPHDYLLRRLGRHIGRLGTYHRNVAAHTPGVTLYRLGEAFVDTMAEYIEWDDRGRTSAIWRHERGWSPAEGEEWTGFRFHFVSEADVAPALQVLRQSGLSGVAPEAVRRRADAGLPPQFETVWVRSDGRPVEDRRLLQILGRPFRRAQDFGTDYNLRKHRLEVLDQVIDRGVWPKICTEARAAAESALRSDAAFQSRIAERLDGSRRQLEHRLDQLRLREGAQGEDERRAAEMEAALGEALLGGVGTPTLRLDAVTFVVVSGRNPFQFERSGF